jgi:hypothetical protein
MSISLIMCEIYFYMIMEAVTHGHGSKESIHVLHGLIFKPMITMMYYI